MLTDQQAPCGNHPIFVFSPGSRLFGHFPPHAARCRGRGPGRAAVCRADEKQIEYKSRRMRRELATTPAWVLSWGIEMAKTENRKLGVQGGHMSRSNGKNATQNIHDRPLHLPSTMGCP